MPTLSDAWLRDPDFRATVLFGVLALVQWLTEILRPMAPHLRGLVLRSVSATLSVVYAGVLMAQHAAVGPWTFVVLVLTLSPVLWYLILSWAGYVTGRRYTAFGQASALVAALLRELRDDPHADEGYSKAEKAVRRVAGVLSKKGTSAGVTPDAAANDVAEQADLIVVACGRTLAGAALSQTVEATAALSLGSAWSRRAPLGLQFDLRHLPANAQLAASAVRDVAHLLRSDPGLFQAQRDGAQRALDDLCGGLESLVPGPRDDNTRQRLKGARATLAQQVQGGLFGPVLTAAVDQLLKTLPGWR